MAERMIRAGNLEIWTESFGDPADPTIVLIAGFPAQGIMWPDELCEQLADGGRHVIRYDHRDTGWSTTIDFATDPYTISDMAADAVGVLDAYSVPSAHLVGFSGGGIVAQAVALEHPGRVSSLTSWGSTPLLGASVVAAVFEGGTDGGPPGPEQKVLDALAFAFRPPEEDEEPSDRLVAVQRAFAGTLEPFDEQAARALARRVRARARDIEAGGNHFLALASTPDRTEELSRIMAPTLVIHGTADPGQPLAQGEATAKAIPGARLLTVDGMGHDFPRPAFPQIVAAILEHTSRVPNVVQGA